MYVVVVKFEFTLEHASDFRAAMLEQAKNSLENEPGCRRFDVCEYPLADTRLFLYELYDDRAAFERHLESDHYVAFDALTADWVIDKNVELYSMIEQPA